MYLNNHGPVYLLEDLKLRFQTSLSASYQSDLT